MLRVLQRSALEKVELDMILERSSSDDISILRPYRRIPLPFFDKRRISFENQLAQPRQQRAAPIRKLCDVVCDVLRWGRSVIRVGFFHGFSLSLLPRSFWAGSSSAQTRSRIISG